MVLMEVYCLLIKITFQKLMIALMTITLMKIQITIEMKMMKMTRKDSPQMIKVII